MLLPRLRTPLTGSQPCIASLESALSTLRLSQSSSASLRPTTTIRNSTSLSQGRANGAKDGAGKRLGAKKSGEQYVIPGNIIFRQRGTHWFPGDNCAMGRDHTIYATHPGFVKYYRDPRRHPQRQFIGVVFERGQSLPQPPNAVRRRRLGMLAYRMPGAGIEAVEGGIEVGDEGSGGGAESGAKSGGGMAALEKAVEAEERGKRKGVKLQVPAKAVPALRPGYQYRMANWEIGRAAERAKIEVKEFKPRDRFLAWRKTGERKVRNAERRGLKKQR